MLINKPAKGAIHSISENTADSILARLNDAWTKHNMPLEDLNQLKSDCNALLMSWYSFQPQIERIARDRDDAEAKARKWATVAAERGQVVIRLGNGTLDADGNERVKQDYEIKLGRNDG